jgi:hypothetical protein
VRAGGGFGAVTYVLKKGREAGGLVPLYRRLRARNACKTCALGMGGQQGGMVNERGHFPEVCKKSVQAQAGDMAGPIAEDWFRSTPIAAMERLGSAELERLGRLGFPLLATEEDRHFRRVSWAEALDRAGAALRAARPEEVFFYASGRSSNEAAFLFQLVARAYGSANVHNCSFYCHSASAVALGQVYGSATASIGLDDLGRADLVLVAGANPASNHPRLVTQLVQLRRRGGKVIVVNPLRELGLVRFRVPSDWRSLVFGSTVSDLYLQPHVGGDVALFTALLKGIVERAPSIAPSSRRTPPGGRRSRPRSRRPPGTRSSRGAASRAPTWTARSPCSRPPDAASSAGRWASRTTRTGSTTCSRSRTWRSPAAGSAARVPGSSRSAATRTCRASARAA